MPWDSIINTLILRAPIQYLAGAGEQERGESTMVLGIPIPPGEVEGGGKIFNRAGNYILTIIIYA